MEAWFVPEANDIPNVDVWKIKDTQNISDLLASDFTFLSLIDFLQEHPAVRLSEDDCFVTKESVTSHYDYNLSLNVTKEEKESIVIVSGIDSKATEETLAYLLSWLGKQSTQPNIAETDSTDLTLKAFATQPRQMLPNLKTVSGIDVLRFHFFAIERPLDIKGATSLEFRQSTMTSWEKSCFEGLKHLTVSCTMPEFEKFALPPQVSELNMMLHFFLQGDPFKKFCNLLEANRNLISLSIKYLDIPDTEWDMLMKSLRGHPTLKVVKLAFTDSFVDNFRRLTPERRKQRSQAVLGLVQSSATLADIDWPEFQKDVEIAAEIATCLQSKIANETK